MKKLTDKERLFVIGYQYELTGEPGPAFACVKLANLAHAEMQPFTLQLTKELRAEGVDKPPMPLEYPVPWNSVEEFRARARELRASLGMTFLTPEEKNFCDHLDHEDTHAPYEKGVLTPACEWMKLHGLTQQDIWDVLMLRRRERKDVMLPEKPIQPYAAAWTTAEEAKSRNRELGAINGKVE